MESLFIQQALDAFNSTNRRHYVLYGQTVSNLDAAAFYLRQAHSLTSPAIQADITISLANIDTFRGNLTAAITMFNKALQTASPHQRLDLLCYLAVWHHAVGEYAQSQVSLAQLSALSPTAAQRVSALLHSIESQLAQPICYRLPARTAGFQPTPVDSIRNRHAIVTLGYRLNADGSMAQPLLERLELTRRLAIRSPNSLIIVTGGLAVAGNTEAQLMKRWLIKNGIESGRIIQEDQAVNTIENTLYTLAIIQQEAIMHITLVSASIHVHRSHILFDSIQRTRYHQPLVIDHVAVQDMLATQATPCGQTRVNCYIDALRGWGLPAFRCGSIIQL